MMKVCAPPGGGKLSQIGASLEATGPRLEPVWGGVGAVSHTRCNLFKMASKAPSAAKSCPTEPPTKKSKTEEQKVHNDMSTFFKRCVDGKRVKATADEKEQAKIGLDLLRSKMSQEKKHEFIEAFKTNKGKAMNWVKEFAASLTTRTSENDRALENYYTRMYGAEIMEPYAAPAQG